METEGREYAYDSAFFDYMDVGSSRSARAIVPLMRALLGVGSVLDVGCGRGVWLREWGNHGVADAVGADGAYVNVELLAIPREKFVKLDLAQPFDLHRQFDLVQCLEVGEHIQEVCAEVLVDNLAAHGDAILFSAAVPGQGGEFHVNEQPYAYWRDKFAARGFRTFDWLRPRILRVPGIEPWYRYNALLFVRGAALDNAPAQLLETEILHDEAVPTRAPLSWRLRNAVLAQLPQRRVHQLAILKHKLILMQRTATRQ